MACEVHKRGNGEGVTNKDQSLGAGNRETPGEGWRAGHGDRPSKKNGPLETTAEKRTFVHDHFAKFGSVAKACRAARISVSSYYYQSKKDEITEARKDAEVRDQIEKVQAEFPFYGYRRIHEDLERIKNITVNEKKILRIMRQYGLWAQIWRGFKVKTTDSNHNHGYAPNLLPGRKITGINQVWVTDITYIRILTGFVYLAAIVDLYSRKVVGWAISDRIDHVLCLNALSDAIVSRRPPRGLIHHSDRGVQYACEEYRMCLVEHGLVPSMSAKGYCYDNAFMESFFKTLKAEEVYLTDYETIKDVDLPPENSSTCALRCSMSRRGIYEEAYGRNDRKNATAFGGRRKRPRGLSRSRHIRTDTV